MPTGSLGGSLKSTASKGTAGRGCTLGSQKEQSTSTVGADHGGVADHTLCEHGGGDEADGGGLHEVEHGFECGAGLSRLSEL